jgi:hypothetical protein
MHLACGRCLRSQFGDARWGPLILSPGEIETNVAGCIALLDPSAIECARTLEAQTECQHAACEPVCSASSDLGFEQRVQCFSAANECSCKSWFLAADCAKPIATSAGPAAQCLVAQTFEDSYDFVAQVFCGP